MILNPMLKFILYSFVWGFCFFVGELSVAQQQTRNLLSTPNSLKDVAYSFDQNKLDAAPDCFHVLRTFVDYFYLLIKENKSTWQTLGNISGTNYGWCVGDAHLENFGIMHQQGGKPIFTMNDMDDSGPCPVELDLFRFIVSSKLYNKDSSVRVLVDAYSKGIHQESFSRPTLINDLFESAKEKGGAVINKKKFNGQQFKDVDPKNRINQSDSLWLTIHQALNQWSKETGISLEVLDMITSKKMGGGSGGLKRFEILAKVKDEYVHLELKTQVTPGINALYLSTSSAPFSPIPVLPETYERIKITLSFEQSLKPYPYYSVLKIGQTDMLLRPRFAGDVGVTLSENDFINNQNIAIYEAYVLGRIHSHSLEQYNFLQNYIENFKKYSLSAWENDVARMTDFFNAKCFSLK